MDSYDNDLMLLMLMDDDLFLVDIKENEQEQTNVDKVSKQSNRT